jgi:integrase
LVLGKGGRPKKASTLATDQGRIKRHIVPLLGKKKVRELRPTDVARFIRDITVGKTVTDERTGRYGRAIVKGGAGTAARTAGLLSGIMAFAIQEGIRPDNPCHGVRKPAAGARQRRLDAADYRALGEALTDFVSGGGSPTAAAMVSVLALTGVRLGEVLSLRCSEVDRPGQALRLADTKSGASVRPLSMAAMTVLDGVVRPAECPFVFPSPRGEGRYLGLRNAFRRIVALRPEQLKGVTSHTLRHSFASTAADLGYSELTVGALIGHRTGTVTSRYVHQLDKVLVAAADRVASQIEAWMQGNPGGEVVMLMGRENGASTSHPVLNVRDSGGIMPLRSSRP